MLITSIDVSGQDNQSLDLTISRIFFEKNKTNYANAVQEILMEYDVM